MNGSGAESSWRGERGRAWRLLTPAAFRGVRLEVDPLAGRAKDMRYHELVAETLGEQFDFRFLVAFVGGAAAWAQPVFVVDQDLLEAAPKLWRAAAGWVRRVMAGAMRSRILMAGCAAGEGYPCVARDGDDGPGAAEVGRALVWAAGVVGAEMVVFKDVPGSERGRLRGLRETGYRRIAGMPAVSVGVDRAGFESCLARVAHSTRKNIRRKLRGEFALEMEVRVDVSDVAAELAELYGQVYARAESRFERLTPEFFAELGRRLPERARFFLWRAGGRIVAFSVCLLENNTLCDEYLGMCYPLAIERSLYHRTLKDLLDWAGANGFARYRSTPLSYMPKRQMRFRLEPLDQWVRYRSGLANGLLGPLMRLLEPARHDPVLRGFDGYGDL